MCLHIGSVVFPVSAAFTLPKVWLVKRKKNPTEIYLAVAMLKKCANIEHWLSFASVHTIS